MLKVVNNTAPSFTGENIEVSILHADVKSGALKNTHVTLMKKNVTIASIKLAKVLLLIKSVPCPSFIPSAVTANGKGTLRTSFINFSIHK